jgi:hypothetical protein
MGVKMRNNRHKGNCTIYSSLGADRIVYLDSFPTKENLSIPCDYVTIHGHFNKNNNNTFDSYGHINSPKFYGITHVTSEVWRNIQENSATKWYIENNFITDDLKKISFEGIKDDFPRHTLLRNSENFISHQKKIITL